MIVELLGVIGVTGFLIGRKVKATRTERNGVSYLNAQHQLIDDHYDPELYEKLRKEIRMTSQPDLLWERIEQYKRNRGYYYLVYSKNLTAHWGTNPSPSRWRTVGRQRGPSVVDKKGTINAFMHDLLMVTYDRPTIRYITEQMKTVNRDFRNLYLLDTDNRLRYSPELAADLLENRWIERAEGEDHDALVYFIGGYEFDRHNKEHRKHVAMIIAENIKELMKPNAWYPAYPPEIIGPLYKADTLEEYEEFLSTTGAVDDPAIRQNITDRADRAKVREDEYKAQWMYSTPPTYVPESPVLDELLCCILVISRLNW